MDRKIRRKYHTQIDFLLKMVEARKLAAFFEQNDLAKLEEIKHDHEWDGLSCACGGGWLVGHLAGCPETLDEPLSPLAVTHRDYPEDMTPDLMFILGQPNFQCAPIAHALRAGGADIARKAEAEQAYVIHWMIKLVLDHPEEWRKRVGDRLTEIAAAAAKKEDLT